jgi:hypothetical protein
MAAIFDNLIWSEGRINPSGIKSEIYYAPKTWITAYPAIDPLADDATGNVTMDGDFTMAEGKTFKKLYSTQGVGKVWWETIGEKDCKMFINKGTFKFPDIDDAGKSMAKSLVNANVVYVIPIPHESEKRYVMIGDEYWDTTSEIGGDSGDAPGSAKGVTINVESPASTPLANYKGILPLPDGSLDCATGIFTPSGGSI